MYDHEKKKGGYSKTLFFPNTDKTKRVYLEFYLTPPGTFYFPDDYPKAYLINNDIFTKIIMHSLSQKLILLVRFALISNFDWHNDVEIAIEENKI